MTTLEKIKTKVTHIDIDELIKRLKMELKIINKEKEESTSEINPNSLLEYAMYDTLLIILDITHQKKINESLYSIWISMIKDYWYLNKYDKLINSSSEEEDNLEVSSIKEGDTQVNFSSNSSTIDINGTKYSVGTINFDINVLTEKYKKDLYRHRKFRW